MEQRWRCRRVTGQHAHPCACPRGGQWSIHLVDRGGSGDSASSPRGQSCL